MNTYKKGKRVEAKAKKYYEKLGYEVETVRYNPYMKQKDYFGLWDLICVGHHNIRFVQVKANKPPSKEWKERANAWGPTGNNIIREWVVYKDYSRGLAPSAQVTLCPKS